MEKSADAFRTISEVASELDVPTHVLRFWEAKFPQVKPMKRGGGRRFYRPGDVDLLRGIRQLLYESRYTIKGVQIILRRDGVEFVKNCGRDQDEVMAASESTEIPDLAMEMAQEAFGNSSTAQEGGTSVGGKKPHVASSLHPMHSKLLVNAVNELELCHKRLIETGK